MRERTASAKTVVGLFESRDDAERAAEELIREGFNKQSIGVIAGHELSKPEHHVRASENAEGKVVDAVVKLAHALGLRVVAEGVENVRQQEILRELGCDEMQGYMFAKPMSARALQRSVRVVLTRPQMYVLGYRPAMIQRVELGANTEGTLDAIMHDAITVTSAYEEYFRQETGWSGLLYKCDNAKYGHRLARLDLPTSCDMRAPSAATAVYALESAMDELAVALDLDPFELRLRCYSERDQNEGKHARRGARSEREAVHGPPAADDQRHGQDRPEHGRGQGNAGHYGRRDHHVRRGRTRGHVRAVHRRATGS